MRSLSIRLGEESHGKEALQNQRTNMRGREVSPHLLEHLGRIEALAPGPAADLACGEGRHSTLLFERAIDVVGLDIDADRLKAADEECRTIAASWSEAEPHPSWSFLPVDLEHEVWPLENYSFGIVKLHGSIDWRRRDGELIRSKDQKRRRAYYLNYWNYRESECAVIVIPPNIPTPEFCKFTAGL